MKIKIKILDKEFYTDWPNTEEEHRHYLLPTYATNGSAAMDLRCTEDTTIYPGERVKIPTGLAIWTGSEQRGKALVIGKELVESVSVAGLILPRSGLGTKGLVLANTVGLIDEDYKSELIVSAWNSNKTPDQEFINCEADEIEKYEEITIRLKAGDRIAQLMFVPVIKAQWNVVEEFSDSAITRGGFGSTGCN